jgi:PAS domain S-box-containing protein
MDKPLNVLILEDSADDAALLVRALERAGYAPRWERVETEEAFGARLSPELDVVLADYRLPGFDALGALARLRAADLDIPFLVVTGALGDEAAAACIREGADDFLLKDRLGRLGAAVEGALEQKRLREKRARDQGRIRHLHVVLDTVRSVNRLIARERDPARLLADACALLVGTRGYRLVWVGLVDHGHTQVVPAARAGHGGAFLETAAITWDAGPFGQGVTGTAIRERRPDVCLDVFRDPRMAPWREAALARGTRSSLAVPLLHGERLFGSLTVYAERADAFDEEEVDLLLELAGDLAFALQGIEEETRRKQAEAALKESEERFRSLVEHSLVGFFIVQEGRVVFLNPEQERILGALPDSLDLADFAQIHPEDRERFLSLGEPAGGKSARWGATDIRFLSPVSGDADGRTRWTICRTTPVSWHGREAVLVHMVDITQIKEMERIALVQEKMASLGHVATGIAHEIRNPLSGLNIYLSALEKTLKESETLETEVRETTQEILAMAHAASNRIEAVIRRVMDFASPAPPAMAPVCLNHCVREALHLAAVTLRKAGIHLDEALEENLPPCRGDARLLEQVLLNLLTNAAQAMEGKEGEKRIAVASFRDGEHAVVTVADSGPGVPLHLRDKIFDPFFTTKKKGTGVGLSLSHKVISDHGGFLTVGTSALGGAEFRLTFPIPSGSPRGKEEIPEGGSREEASRKAPVGRR